jgi:hypothetical protein
MWLDALGRRGFAGKPLIIAERMPSSLALAGYQPLLMGH